MSKGPGIHEYLTMIHTMKEKAASQGEVYIDVSSKALHTEISPDHATMPTCCQAMYRLMLQGDEILRRPKGQTGYGSRLHVRYYLGDMQTRAPLYPPKKRGRPVKDGQSRLKEQKMRTNWNTESLIALVRCWLEDQGWATDLQKNMIVATKHHDRWMIYVQGSRRGRKQPLYLKIHSVFKEIEDENARTSMALNDSTLYRKQWGSLPRLFKSKLNMSVLLADKAGNIQEVS